MKPQRREAKPHITADFHQGYGWVMRFPLTDGDYERIAVDREEAKRIAHRVLPGWGIWFNGPSTAA